MPTISIIGFGLRVFGFGVGPTRRVNPRSRSLPRLDVHARPRVEVGFERLLAGPLVLRHVDQVDPDAIPERRPAAHAVDQDVGRLEVLDDVRVARLPALEALERLVLELRPGDLDDRDRRLAPAGRRRLRTDPLGREAGVRVAGGDRGRTFGGDLRWRPARLAAPGLVLGRRAARLRRLDPWRFAGLLRVVRRPRGVAQALGLVAGAQLQERLERADRVVDPGARVADRRRTGPGPCRS